MDWIGNRAARVALLFLLAGAVLLAPRSSSAEPGFDLSLRQLGNVTHFGGVTQEAVELQFPMGWRLGGWGRVEFDWLVSGGALRDAERDTAFVSLGQAVTLRAPLRLRAVALQASFSPTWTETDRLNGQDFGGHVHFTSAVALKLFLDRAQRQAIAFRAQHTSNGGLEQPNPGLDLAGIELSWNFGRASGGRGSLWSQGATTTPAEWQPASFLPATAARSPASRDGTQPIVVATRAAGERTPPSFRPGCGVGYC